MKSTIIEFDYDSRRWVIIDTTNPKTKGISYSLFQTLALGNYEWNIENDNGCQEGKVAMSLSLTACKTHEYTCNDGLCLPLDKRCDGISNCKDSSDELQCSIVVKDNSYNKFLSPPPDNSEKVVVNVSITVFALSNFDPITASFEADLTVSLTWFDMRLTFGNLRNSSSNNALSPSEKQNIWFPVSIFENTKDKLEVLVDEKAMLIVRRKGKGRKTDSTSTENKLLYRGLENPITYRRFYNEIFKCDYNIQWYPFDTQRCTINLVPSSSLVNFIVLEPDKFAYKGPLMLKTYEVISIRMIKGKTSLGEKVLEVEILIGRRLLSIILIAIIPTVLLNIIGHMSNFFKKFFFEAIISLNVTVMLVLTTMFISISNNLPKTAYIKMIDVWLIFNLMKPFVDILVQTYIETLRTDEDEREINHHGKTIKIGENNEGGIVQVATEGDINKLRSINEKIQQDSLRKYYAKLKSNEEKIKSYQHFVRVTYPTFCVCFVILFWLIGLYKTVNSDL